MNKYIYLLFAVVLLLGLSSCAVLLTTPKVSKGSDISQYKYVVYNAEYNGDTSVLEDILPIVQNVLSKRLKTISSSEAQSLSGEGENILTPRIDIKSTNSKYSNVYITIGLYDLNSNHLVASVKSKGVGLFYSKDNKIHYSGIKTQLNRIFK